LLFEFGDFLIGFAEDFESVFILFDFGGEGERLEFEHIDVEFDEFEIGGGSGVISAAEFLEELFRVDVDIGVNLDGDGAEVCKMFTDSKELLGFVLFFGDGVESVSRPAVEPVNSAAVNDGGELPATIAKFPAYRRESEDDMEVFSDEGDEEFDELVSGVDFSSFFGEDFDIADDFLVVFRRHEVGDFACVEDVVDIFEEGFFDDLDIGEEEDDRGAFGTGLLEERLEVVLPLGFFVGFGDFDGEAFVAADEGGEASKAASAGAAHADEESVASGVTENTANSGEMGDGVKEEDEVHVFVEFEVVVAKVVIEFLDEFERLGDEDVVFIGIGIVTKHVVFEFRSFAVFFEIGFELVVDLVVEPIAILVVGKTVGEDTCGLVDPEGDEQIFAEDVIEFHLKNALNDFGEISEVESVVAFGGSGEQLLGDFGVDFYAGLDEGEGPFVEAFDSGFDEEAAKDLVEDGFHGAS